MLKQTLKQARPVAQATLVDNNGIPYQVIHNSELEVDVYSSQVKVKVEGRKYVSLEGIEFQKLSYTAVGQLATQDGDIIPYILPERFSCEIDSQTIHNLIRLDVARVCYEVTNKSGERVAPLNLLGVHGAKLDKKGYPVLFTEETIQVKDINKVSEGDVVSVRVLYAISNSRTYITAYPQVKAGKVHAYPTVEFKEGKTSLTEKPFNSVEFFDDLSNIQQQVRQLVQSNWA